MNNHTAKYDEAKIDRYLKEINPRLEKGDTVLSILGELEKKMGGTNEFRLIRLLFDLAGVKGNPVYKSVSEIIPLLDELVVTGIDKGMRTQKSFWFSHFKNALKRLLR